MEANRLNTAGNTTGKEDSEKPMVMVLITILSSENSSPFCQFFDGCYCSCKTLGLLSNHTYHTVTSFSRPFWRDFSRSLDAIEWCDATRLAGDRPSPASHQSSVSPDQERKVRKKKQTKKMKKKRKRKRRRWRKRKSKRKRRKRAKKWKKKSNKKKEKNKFFNRKTGRTYSSIRQETDKMASCFLKTG